jgi:hypothetical protein
MSRVGTLQGLLQALLPMFGRLGPAARRYHMSFAVLDIGFAFGPRHPEAIALLKFIDMCNALDKIEPKETYMQRINAASSQLHGQAKKYYDLLASAYSVRLQ